MPTLQWALTCQRVITDNETNAVSYIDALEGFAVAEFPLPFPPVCVATLWRRDEPKETLDLRLRVLDPSHKLIMSFELDKPQALSKKRHRFNIFIGGGAIKTPGEYQVLIEQRAGKRWRRAATLPIEITQLPSKPTAKRTAKRKTKRTGNE